MSHGPWENVAREIQAHRARTLAQVQPPVPNVPSPLPRNVTAIPQMLLSPREVELTTIRAEDLVALLAARKLKSTEVTQAFLRSACLAQKLVNLLELSDVLQALI